MVEQRKVCFKCRGKPKPLSEFYTHPKTADGHLGKCKSCTKEDTRINYANNRDYYVEYDKRRQKKPKRRKAKVGYLRKFRHSHPGFTAAHDSKRRARLKQAMPEWANFTEIKRIYMKCPRQKVVDHIIPLVNKLVCGMHVPCNLQYLTPLQNSKKGNSFEPIFTCQPL